MLFPRKRDRRSGHQPFSHLSIHFSPLSSVFIFLGDLHVPHSPILCHLSGEGWPIIIFLSPANRDSIGEEPKAQQRSIPERVFLSFFFFLLRPGLNWNLLYSSNSKHPGYWHCTYEPLHKVSCRTSGGIARKLITQRVSVWRS